MLDPLCEPSWYWPFRGIDLFITHRFEPAVAALNRSPTMPVWVSVYIAAAEALRGRSSVAKSYASIVLRDAPFFSATRFAEKEPYRLDEDRNLLLKGMREAKLPG